MQGRSVTPRGLELLKRLEGCRREAYQDTGGVWTIGYGHTHGVHEGDRIDQEEADELLLQDLHRTERGVARLVTAPLKPNQRDALECFAFNVGVGAFANSTLLARVNLGDFEGVPRELMRWVHDGGREVPGLVNRRQAEIALWSET